MAIDQRRDDPAVDEMRWRGAMMLLRHETRHTRTLSSPKTFEVQTSCIVWPTTEAMVMRNLRLKRKFRQRYPSSLANAVPEDVPR